MNLAEAGARAGVANTTRTNLRGTALNAQYGLMNTGRGLSGGGGIGEAAGGLAKLGQQAQARADQNNASAASAVGTAATLAASAGWF